MPLFLDFETRSCVDLRKVGLHRYAADPSTDIWCMGYAFDDEPTQVWLRGTPFPSRVTEHVAAGKEAVSHNAAFERAIWNAKFHKFPPLTLDQLTCTMAACYAMALPGSLENAAAALGLRVTKDGEGRTLMLRMCKPSTTFAGEPRWVTDQPEFTFLGEKRSGEWALARLADYCKTDVDVERAIYKRVLPLSAFERQVWQLDQKINDRGIGFDADAVAGARKIRDDVLRDLDARMKAVTQGAVAACSNVGALKAWALDYGVATESVSKADLGELLDEEQLPKPVRTAFELRRESGRATSVTKLDAVARMEGKGYRVRGLYQYHGAATGRWAGRAVQPHNFTRDLPPPRDVEDLLALVKAGRADLIDVLYGAPLTMISKVLRGFVVAAPGKTLIGGDWSNIEGRGLAWLAGERWKIDAFRAFDAGTGPDIYKKTYASAFGLRVEDVTSDQRQIGKVMELSMGYGGGVGAFQAMARTYMVSVSDDTAEEAKVRWREAHPRTRSYWYALHDAAMDAVRGPGMITVAGAPGRQVRFRVRGSFLWCRLPSGRTLCYPYPQLREGKYGEMLTYKTVPSVNDRMRGHIVEDRSNTNQWARVGTFGGKLAENVTQAICRDLLATALLELEKGGLPVVMHTHDDALAEGDFSTADVERFQTIMVTNPPWAAGLPLACEVWSARRYRKG